MAIDERARHELYLRAEESLGPEAAETLMGLLPPVGWADVATKRDLEQLELHFDLKLDKLEARMGERLEAALKSQTWRLTTLVMTVATIAVAASKLG